MRICIPLLTLFVVFCFVNSRSNADDPLHSTTVDIKLATAEEKAAPKPEELKYEFVGKLISSEKYFAGWGAAAGRFPHYKMSFEVIEVRKGDLKVGQVLLCDQSATLRYKTPLKATELEVGKKYVVGSPYKHPGSPKVIFLQESRLSECPGPEMDGEAASP